MEEVWGMQSAVDTLINLQTAGSSGIRLSKYGWPNHACKTEGRNQLVGTAMGHGDSSDHRPCVPPQVSGMRDLHGDMGDQA